MNMSFVAAKHLRCTSEARLTVINYLQVNKTLEHCDRHSTKHGLWNASDLVKRWAVHKLGAQHNAVLVEKRAVITANGVWCVWS